MGQKEFILPNVAVNDCVAHVHAVYTLLDKLPCSLGSK